jgi:serine protease inhibitor
VAAAATVIALKRKRKETKKDEPLTFIANQPFFFLLEHTPSKSVIFIAKIHNPAM